MNQVIGLVLVTYILAHPDVVPRWMSSFEVSRLGVPQNGASICDHAGMRHKRDVGGMTGPMPVMNLSVMRGPMMHGHMMHGHMMDGRMMDGPMMPGHHGGGMFPGGSQSDKEKPADSDGGKQLPKLDDLMLPGKMMPDVSDMMPKVHDSVGVQLADVLSNPDNKISAKRSDADDDHRELTIPVGSQSHDGDSHYPGAYMDPFSKQHVVGLNAGE